MSQLRQHLQQHLLQHLLQLRPWRRSRQQQRKTRPCQKRQLLWAMQACHYSSAEAS